MSKRIKRVVEGAVILAAALGLTAAAKNARALSCIEFYPEIAELELVELEVDGEKVDIVREDIVGYGSHRFELVSTSTSSAISTSIWDGQGRGWREVYDAVVE